MISQSGFSGEAGYEIYLRNATLYAEDMWNAVLKAGKKHKLMVIAPAHHRRIQAGILSWGQDMDHQHNPFQCNLGYQVSLSGKGQWSKQTDYIGKEALEKMKQQLKNGEKPYKLQLVGLELKGGKPIEDYANDFLVNLKWKWRKTCRLHNLTLVSSRKRKKYCYGLCSIRWKFK